MSSTARFAPLQKPNECERRPSSTSTVSFVVILLSKNAMSRTMRAVPWELLLLISLLATGTLGRSLLAADAVSDDLAHLKSIKTSIQGKVRPSCQHRHSTMPMWKQVLMTAWRRV